MSKSPEELAHIEWLGYVQPVGLVVSIPALLEAQCYVNKNIMGDHARFLSWLATDQSGDLIPEVTDLPLFLQQVLDWRASDLREIPKLGDLPAEMSALEVILPQYHETLRPTHVVPAFQSAEGQRPWIMLIQSLDHNTGFDESSESDSSRHWNATPHAKFERLLRESTVALGMLFNGRQFRLVYAPRGETSGFATFNVDEMAQVAGRPMFAAFQMLFGADRMFNLAEKQRLPYILENSRKYQNVVSTALSEQVTAALFELLRGFQAANDHRNGELLQQVLARDPQHVYHGLLTVLMRLVFVLYAEDRGLVSSDPVYTNHYSVSGLFERLRSEAGRFPDTMDQRFGAWAQLLTLFRLVYEGGQHAEFKIPARKGYLFDPDRYPFLEGRVECGESREVKGNEQENDNGDSKLSGIGGLAKGDRSLSGMLSSDEAISNGGAIRDDEPTSTGRGVDSSEYRRGTGATGNQGVSQLFGDREGLSDGSGNASDSQPKSRPITADGSGQTPFAYRPNQPNVDGPAEVVREKTLGGSKLEVGEWKEASDLEPLATPNTHHARRTSPSTRHTPLLIPRISDGVIYRVFEDLLILDGERLSYRTLDVEQIGSVYEAIMGFELQVSAGKSIAIKPVKSHGSPATINLEALLAAKPADRTKLLNEWTDQKLGNTDSAALKDAKTIDELLAVLEKKIAKHATPAIVPKGSMVFQPSDERRRSGSHYTPRSLTEPIVRTTLEPILKQLVTHPDDLNRIDTEAQKHNDTEAGSNRITEAQSHQVTEKAQSFSTDSSSPNLRASVVQPRPIPKELQKRLTKGEIAERERIEQKRAANYTAAIAKGVPHPNQILDLKICDPAMGSGAFLVEACRQLADELIKSWAAHADSLTPNPQSLIPPDEDEVLYARRIVAQRCLYGVDKNIMAVDLAKLSLWLVTLAKDHPFTFLDHALRHGDSLVGLTREQIIGFHWEHKKQQKFGEKLIQKRLDDATEARAKILSAREDVAYRDQEQRMTLANDALDLIRLLGDACVSCFFAADKKKAREEELKRVFGVANAYLEELNRGKLNPELRQSLVDAATTLRTSPHPLHPFHWEIEFPEVFSRENGGFDAFVGNPPFLGGTSISTANGKSFLDWLNAFFPETGDRMDLVAYFFRQAYSNLRTRGTFGFIATNTISQGDTRRGGLRYIRKAGGTIYNALRRKSWPGQAAVAISIIHIQKVGTFSVYRLDDVAVDLITAFLFHRGSDEDPKTLRSNADIAFNGVYILGLGFTFDDRNPAASLFSTLDQIEASNPRSLDRIQSYIGGDEVNDCPLHAPTRKVINMSGLSENEAREQFPELIELLEQKVKPERLSKAKDVAEFPWWRFWRERKEMQNAIASKERFLACARHQPHWTLTFLPAGVIPSDALVIFARDDNSSFCTLQSRVHEVWLRFFASSLEDRLRYTPSDCFDNFPFPSEHPLLEHAGRQYWEYRSKVMVENNAGMTKTYNRFHSPDERDPGILELRRLHGEMDVAVLRAYGWNDLADQASQPDFCQFLLDYEEEVDSESQAQAPNLKSRKKPWRYRWPDEFRDEVLARLLELNEQRHKEELLLAKGKATEAKPAKEPSKKPAKATPLLDVLDQVELDRDERIILLVVGSFKLITRTAVDEAFVAMKYPKLRKSRLGLGDPPKSIPRTDAGRDTLIGGLVDRGFIEKHPSDHQQVWKLGTSAPSLTATAAERRALGETKAIFQNSIDANDDLASCKEGVTDAKPGLVSIT